MAEKDPGQSGQEEVQDILSDLDNILQTLTESAREVQAATSALPAEPRKPSVKPPPAHAPQATPKSAQPVKPTPPAPQPVKPTPPAQPVKPPVPEPLKAEAKTAPQATPESAQDRGASAHPAHAPQAAPESTQDRGASARPAHAPQAAPESTQDRGASARPAMAPFGEPAKIDRPEPSLPPSVVERVIVDIQPRSAPRGSAPGGEGIELAPRSGIFPTAPKKDKPEVEPPKRGLPTPAFVELPGAEEPPKVELDISASAAPEEPKLELKPAVPVAAVEVQVDLTPESALPVEARQAPQDAVAAPPAAAAASVPVFSGPAEFAANPDPIPDKTPADQIRRIAFLYTTEQKEACEKFAKFIGQVAKTFGKKPIYVHQSARAEVRTDVSPRELLDKLKAAGTVGILAMLEGLPSDKTQELEKVFEDEDIFFRVVAAADAAKRLSAIDHVVDMMLLKAG